MQEAIKPKVAEVAETPKIEVEHSFDILGTTQFDAALNAEIKVVVKKRIPGVKYKRGPYDFLTEGGYLSNNEKLINAYLEILGKESKLPTAVRSFINALCSMAFFKVSKLFTVKQA